jgi:hypothetical protein
MLVHDQLTQQRARNQVFPYFDEGVSRFPPTFKVSWSTRAATSHRSADLRAAVWGLGPGDSTTSGVEFTIPRRSSASRAGPTGCCFEASFRGVLSASITRPWAIL